MPAPVVVATLVAAAAASASLITATPILPIHPQTPRADGDAFVAPHILPTLTEQLDTMMPSLRRFARRTCSSDAEAQDLVQEALLRIVSGARKWDRVANPDLDLYAFTCRVIWSVSYHARHLAASK